MAWTTPRTWVTGEIVTAAIMNTHVRDNLNALNDLLDTVSVSQPANVLTTVYQNTSGKLRLVTISFGNSNMGVGYIYIAACYCDSGAAPTTLMGRGAVHTPTAFGGSNYWQAIVTFLVPNNYYYKAMDESLAGGAIQIVEWTEWDLH